MSLPTSVNGSLLNPGGNSRSVLARAPFRADLMYSLILNRGTGSPTFTRATTATFPDFEGVMRTAIAGEARFVGARRVRNTVSGSSEAFSNASWSKNNVTLSSGQATTPSGVLADLIYPTTSGTFRDISQASTSPGSGTRLVTVDVKSAGFTWARFRNMAGAASAAWFNLTTGANGTVNAGYSLSAQSLGDGWYRLTLSNTSALSTDVFAVGMADADASDTATTSGTSGIYIGRAQREDVTGQSVQTAGEYVSVGVLSAPYHGAGVDGVKYFDTTLAGVPISSSTLKGYLSEGSRQNICLQSNAFTTTWTNSGAAPTQNAIGPDGATSAWTLTDSSAVAVGFISQNITLTAAAYTWSVLVKKTSGAQSSYPVLTALTGTTLAAVTVDTSNGVATAWTAYTGYSIAGGVSASCTSYNANYWLVSLTFTGTVASWTFYIQPAGTTNATQSTGTTDVAAQGSAVFYGAQVELGSFASTYIPTTTVAVTRNADVLSYGLSGNFSDSAGWMYAETNFYQSSTQNKFLIGSTGSGNSPMYQGSGGYRAFDGTNAPLFVAGMNVANTLYKSAMYWNGTTLKMNGALNGTASTESTYDGGWNLTNIQIGGGNAANELFGTIRNVRIGQVALSTGTLGAITQ